MSDVVTGPRHQTAARTSIPRSTPPHVGLCTSKLVTRVIANTKTRSKKSSSGVTWCSSPCPLTQEWVRADDRSRTGWRAEDGIGSPRRPHVDEHPRVSGAVGDRAPEPVPVPREERLEVVLRDVPVLHHDDLDRRAGHQRAPAGVAALARTSSSNSTHAWRVCVCGTASESLSASSSTAPLRQPLSRGFPASMSCSIDVL